MLDHRDNVHHSSLDSIFIHRQLDKPDQLVLKITADEYAAVKVGRTHPADGLEALAIVRKSPTLPNRSLIVDLPDSSHQVIVKRDFADRNAFLLRLLGLISCFKSDLLIPPFIEA